LKFIDFILLLFLSCLDAKHSDLFRSIFYYDTINVTRYTVSEYSLNANGHLEDICEYENNIKMNVQEIERDGVVWINPAHDREKRLL